MPRPRVFLDFTIADGPSQRVIFELYTDVVPKTAENFRALATGEKGLSQISQLPLYYKGCIIHRAIKDFMIQGGDFTKRNGSGGESIYGAPFPDEDLSQPIDAEGLLVMANKGPNTNGSQWFVTLRACPHLDGKHVVFGRVLRGFEIIQAIAAVETDDKDRPLQPVVVTNCGELVRKAAEVKKASTSPERSKEVSEDDDKEHKKKRSKRKHRDEDESASGSEHDSEDDRAERKRSKKHKKKHSSKRGNKDKDKDEPAPQSNEPRQETEEEYDARLEREENERLEATRKHHLEELKRKYERDAKPGRDGVIYKGRGEMRFRG